MSVLQSTNVAPGRRVFLCSENHIAYIFMAAQLRFCEVDSPLMPIRWETVEILFSPQNESWLQTFSKQLVIFFATGQDLPLRLWPQQRNEALNKWEGFSAQAVLYYTSCIETPRRPHEDLMVLSPQILPQNLSGSRSPYGKSPLTLLWHYHSILPIQIPIPIMKKEIFPYSARKLFGCSLQRAGSAGWWWKAGAWSSNTSREQDMDTSSWGAS